MIFSEKIDTNKKLTILLAPLDWGLGHATRCIPIIKHLKSVGIKIIIATSGPNKILLKKEFPVMDFLHLDGYSITYTKNRRLLPLKIVVQIPKIIIRIYKEHLWLKKVVKELAIDAVISDNRFGLFHSNVPCIYITHQLQIKTGNSFFDFLTREMHFLFIKKYRECWVPDFDTPNSVAGALAHPANYPSNVKYIGSLSRFFFDPSVKMKYDILVSLSGPEPQRTILEKILFKQLDSYKGTVFFVRGLPNEDQHSIEQLILELKIPVRILIKNHLSSEALNKIMSEAAVIISRSGYTTIMDLIKLRKRAILIPTPGQTEQEYLGSYLTQKGMFYSVLQQDFLLEAELLKMDNFTPRFPSVDMDLYKESINGFVQSL